MLLALIFICSAAPTSAQKTNGSCSSPSCLDVFSAELDESKFICNVSASVCRCKVQVLDLEACVLSNVSDMEKRFDLVVNGIVPNVAANRFTGGCRAAFEMHGPCKLEQIREQASR